MPLLREVLDFDKYDLEANRKGRLTQRQRRKIVRRWAWNALVSGLFLVFAVTFFGSFMHDPSPNPTISSFIQHAGISLILMVIFFGVFLYPIITPLLDLRSGKPAVVEGKAHATFVNSKGIHHAIQVNGLQFQIPKSAKDHITIGYIYRAYYMPRMKFLLSIEKISNGE